MLMQVNVIIRLERNTENLGRDQINNLRNCFILINKCTDQVRNRVDNHRMLLTSQHLPENLEEIGISLSKSGDPS